MNAKFLLKAVQALRAGHVGDAGAYKAAALSAPAYPDVAAKIEQLANPFPRIDLDSLRTLSANTFGHAYVSFLAAKRSRDLALSTGSTTRQWPFSSF